MYVEKPSNPTNSSCSEPTVKLNNKERAIVNYLKLQKFSPTTTPPIVDLVSDVEIAGATQIKGGVAVVKMILEDLKKKGVVKRDRYGNWALSDRVNYLLKFKLENSSKLSPEVNSTPEDKKSSIELMARDGQLFARVKDLKKHPLNAQIYSARNIQPLLAKIRESQWIKPLGITSEGKIISGNSRHECAQILGWELVEVEVLEFNSEIEELERFLNENHTRIKSTEEIIRESNLIEKIEVEKAKQRKVDNAIALNDKLKSQQNTNPLNSTGSIENINTSSLNSTAQDSQKGEVRDIVAKKVGMGWQKRERGKKVVARIDALSSRGLNGAAQDLRETLNARSVNAAHLKLKAMYKLEKIMSDLEKNNDETRADLEYVLQHQKIGDAIELTKRWKRELKSRSQPIKAGEVVKIKTKLCLNEWAIVDTNDDFEFTCNLMVRTGELRGIHKAELNHVELSDEEKKAALDLMLRLQRVWGQLEQLKDEQPLREFVKAISVKETPNLTELQSFTLDALESKTTEILTRQLKQKDTQ